MPANPEGLLPVEQREAIARARQTARDPIACRRDSVGMVDLTAADLRIVLGELDAAMAELDRFRTPNERSLSTSDPITPLPTFRPRHLLGLALLFREWCHAELWGRPNEAELAARQVETAHARIAELEEALRPFADACMISNREDAEDIDDTLAATKITWGDLRRARTALSQVPSQEGK